MWKPEWNAISSRIAGLIEASNFLFANARTDKRDHLYSTEVLIDNCNRTAEAVLNLRRYRTSLLTKANHALTQFERQWRRTAEHFLSLPRPQLAQDFQSLEARVVLLASIRSELDHLLADQDAIIRSHVNRAFRHLDRTLIVDEEVRRKWLRAFEEGETACEKLGALHLLAHGIWAFKANAIGERTDLILGVPLEIDEGVIGAARGMVLTEWKLVRTKDDPDVKKAEAREQANRYSGGGLAGFELDRERYLVLVGESEFDKPKDEVVDQIAYLVVPLFLTRSSPSVAARRTS